METPYAMRKQWIATGSLDKATIQEAMRTLPLGRDRETAKILLEIIDGHPRTNDGETRHILAARNNVLMQEAFARQVPTTPRIR